MNLTNIKITTGAEASKDTEKRAASLAAAYAMQYVRREKKSLRKLFSDTGGPVLVVTKHKLEFFQSADQAPFFYHPNSAALRAKNWIMHGHDPLVAACALEAGDSVIDGTMGLASDGLILSLAGGAGTKVTGVESSPVISLLVKEGLPKYAMPLKELEDAAKRIHVVNLDTLQFLREQASGSTDIIYLDPMFASPIESSYGIEAMRSLANNKTVTKELIDQAVRVAGKRVVLKERRTSPLFETFGFKRIHRSSPAAPIFGYIDCGEVSS